MAGRFSSSTPIVMALALTLTFVPAKGRCSPCPAVTLSREVSPSSSVKNGTAYDWASLEFGPDIITVELPAGTDVTRGSGRSALLYMKKAFGFYGHQTSIMTPCTARRAMGCAYQVVGDRARLGTYGEWSHEEGSANLSLRVVLPASVRVVEVDRLSGAGSEAAEQQPLWWQEHRKNDQEFWFAAEVPASGWTAIRTAPDDTVLAREYFDPAEFEPKSVKAGPHADDVPCIHPACSHLSSHRSDWREVGGSAFCMTIPPDLQRVEVQGTDSEVGEWESSSRRIGYDFGDYSDPLERPREGMEQYSSCWTAYHHIPVKLVTYEGAGYYSAAMHLHFGDPYETLGLTIHASADTAAGRDELMCALWSVKLGGGCPHVSHGDASQGE